jgi:hypothetical protein
VLLAAEPFLHLEVELDPILHLGATPYGDRRIIAILGGRFWGPQLTGRIVAGGADWQLVRSDEVAELEARYTLETVTGERIFVRSDGLRHGPAEVMARLARGEAVDPAAYYFRTILRFEAASAHLGWLNRILTVARGRRDPRTVHLDVYEVL